MTEETEQDAALTQRFRALFARFDASDQQAFAEMRDIYHPDLLFQDPLVRVRGLDDFLRLMRKFQRQARTLHYSIDDFVAREHDIFMTWGLTFAPRVGPALLIEGATHARIFEGRIVYQRDFWDVLSSFLGGVPALGPLYARVVSALARG